MDYAIQFASSYQLFPPGIDASLTVICNGGPPSDASRIIFSPLNCRFLENDNVGWDVGAFQFMANETDADMLVCFGESIHFHKPGWLARLAQAWRWHGPGLYGGTSSNCVRPHLQTTGFACPPSLIQSHPSRVCTKEERYDFEHGHWCITNRALKAGLPVMLVTWDGEYQHTIWRQGENIFWKGDQSNLIYLTNHCDHYFGYDLMKQIQCTRIADGTLL